jgi:hypothetical protein
MILNNQDSLLLFLKIISPEAKLTKNIKGIIISENSTDGKINEPNNIITKL